MNRESVEKSGPYFVRKRPKTKLGFVCDASRGEDCDECGGNVSRSLLSIFNENVTKAFVSLMARSLEKDYKVAAPRDMASKFAEFGFVLGGITSKGKGKVKEENYSRLGAIYTREV